MVIKNDAPIYFKIKENPNWENLCEGISRLEMIMCLTEDKLPRPVKYNESDYEERFRRNVNKRTAFFAHPEKYPNGAFTVERHMFTIRNSENGKIGMISNTEHDPPFYRALLWKYRRPLVKAIIESAGCKSITYTEFQKLLKTGQ